MKNQVKQNWKIQVIEKSFQRLKGRIEDAVFECEYWVKVQKRDEVNAHPKIKINIQNSIEKLGTLRLLFMDILEIIYQFAPVGSVLYIATQELNEETYQKLNELKNLITGKQPETRENPNSSNIE
jgi:hypothetical protein